MYHIAFQVGCYSLFPQIFQKSDPTIIRQPFGTLDGATPNLMGIFSSGLIPSLESTTTQSEMAQPDPGYPSNQTHA
jgi:hypothetical protein